MNRKRAFNVGFFTVAAVLVIGVVGAIFYTLRAGGGSLPVLGQAANFTATNVDGRRVSLSDTTGKIRLVTWLYTRCPDECPLTAYDMSRIQDKLEQMRLFGKQVAFVSVTFDPKRDTLPVMKRFADHYHPNFAGWYFLRAEPSQTPAILKSYGVQTKFDDTEFIEHTLTTLLIDGDGNIRKEYNTAALNVDQVVGDIQGLLKRSSWSS